MQQDYKHDSTVLKYGFVEDSACMIEEFQKIKLVVFGTYKHYAYKCTTSKMYQKACQIVHSGASLQIIHMHLPFFFLNS